MVQPPPVDVAQPGNGAGGPPGSPDDNGDFGHFVQFYETEEYLVESVGAFLAPALLGGDAALLICTPDHRPRIERELTARGVDVSEASRRGQYVARDAAEALSAVTPHEAPERDRLVELVGGWVDELSRDWPRVRAFGEMVTLLRRESNRDGACHLEELWNELAASRPLALLCAYPLAEFADEKASDTFTRICSAHSRVLPSESYSALRTSDERLRSISSLQQKATALEAAERDRALRAAIVESSDDAIISTDLEGVITSWNRGAERLFGHAAEEALGRSVTLLIPEERYDEAASVLERIRIGERVEHHEAVRRHKSGTPVDVSLTISPIRDRAGRVVGASRIARDVTERRSIDQKLRQTAEQYRRLAALLPVGVYTCEAPHGTITYFNEPATRLWGRTPRLGDTDERFCGSFKLFLPDGDTPLPHADCPMAVALREGRAYRNEEVIVERPDGSRVTALVNIDPILSPGGEVLGAINVLHDITAMKQVEQALVEQKENLQTLLATLPVAVFIAHDPECRRITGNRAGARLLRMDEDANFSMTAPEGEEPGSFRVSRYGQPILPEDLPMQRAARGESVFAEEVDHEFDDGTVIHTLISAQPLHDLAGQPRGCVACVLDVTELKDSERALREADRRKDEFLATLAHELRNPLAPILTGLEIMQRITGDPATLERTRLIMERQAHQLVSLVDDLLDVSRITRGKFELRKRMVELVEIVQMAVEATRPAIDRAGHTLNVVLPDAPSFLEADPNRLAQVLSNLLSNATKYTPQGGRIDLVAEREAGHVRISVTDSGIGIPPEMMDGIFGMFAQIDRPQERGHMGLGIGLTLAKSLVEMHRGSISVRSEGADEGSTFTVRLPTVPGSAEPEDTAGSLERGNGVTTARRVLVVDDNEAMVESLSIVMRLLGNEVRTALNGRQAIEVSADFRPEIVLMDLGMPVMSGYEAAKHIRAQPWGANMRLVALTGWGQDEHRQRTSEAGFDQHLVKPVRPEDLERLLTED